MCICFFINGDERMTRKHPVEFYSCLSKRQQKKYDDLVISVLKRLPERVSASLRRDTRIFIIGTDYGVFIKPVKKLVFLNWLEFTLERTNKEEIMSVIAHEYALAYLNTYNENKVNALCKRWGFPQDGKKRSKKAL
jgi:hypothetical protein